MPDDPLRSPFEELRASGVPLMHAPGVAAVHAKVRRRRRIRTGAAACAMVVVAGLAVTVAGIGPFGGTHKVSTDSSGTPTLEPTPAGSPPADSPSPIPSASHHAATSPSGHQTSGSSTGGGQAGGPVRKACVKNGRAVLTGSSGTYEVRVAPVAGRQLALCAGSSVPLFWASYTVNSDGSGTLFASGTDELTSAHAFASLSVSAPGTCGAWFVGQDASIPGALSVVQAYLDGDASAGGPFWDDRHESSGILAKGSDDCPTDAPTTTPPSGPESPSP